MWKTLFVILVITSAPFAFSHFKPAQKEQSQGGRSLAIVLTGAAATPGPGDPDGVGIAKFIFNQDKGEICYELSVKKIQPATLAHLHAGAARQSGEIKLSFEPPATGLSKGCLPVEPSLIKELLDKPAHYYTDIHNAEFPHGAVRGQLGRR